MFTTIQDPVDAQVAITVDDSTGYYNLTEALAQLIPLYKIKAKNIGVWLSEQSTKELLAEHESENRRYYTYKSSTYIHPAFYVACMSWAAPAYRLKMLTRAIAQ